MKKTASVISLILVFTILISSITLAFSVSRPDTFVNGDTETAGGGKYYFLDEAGRIFEGFPGVADREYVSDSSYDRIAYYDGYIYACAGSGLFRVNISTGGFKTVYGAPSSIKRFSLAGGSAFILAGGSVKKVSLSAGTDEAPVPGVTVTDMWLDSPATLSYMTDGKLIYSLNLESGETVSDVNFYSAFVGDIPVVTASGDGEDGLTFSSLQAKFPAGRYWNHMGSSTNNPGGTTVTPCNHSLNGTTYCNHPTFYSAWQCHGYAIQCGYDIVGSNPMNWTKLTSSSSVNDVRAGDVIRLDYGSNDHTILVLAVNGDTVYFTDCNSYGTCNIRWGYTKTKQTIINQFKYLLKCPMFLSDYYAGGTVNAEYTVKFDLNDSVGQGKAVCSETSRTVKDGASYGALPVPSREGYDFDGWYTMPSGGTRFTADTKAGSNATVYAHWNVKVYIIAYNANADGETISNIPSNQTKKHYETVNLDITSRVLLRSNYTFNYWNTSPDGSGTAYDKQNSTFSGNYDLILYAQWEGIPKSVYFEPQGGNISITHMEVRYGSPYGELPVPVRDGYKFKYWKTSTGTVITSSSIMKESSGIRLYAEWEEGAFNIIYNPNSAGDTVYGMPSDQSRRSTETVTLNLTSPKRYGYTFAGWNSEPDGSGTSFKSPCTYSDNRSITIYAQWKPIVSKVTFDSNGGSAVNTSLEVSYGTTYGNLPSSSLKGKDFLGWFISKEDDGSDPVTASSKVEIIRDTTLYAHWDTAKYSVRYYANNTSVSNMPSNSVREYGQSGFSLDSRVPSRTGFTFLYWNTEDDGSGRIYYPGQEYNSDASLSLYAVWERNSYSVIYDAVSGTGAPESGKKLYDITLTLSETVPVRKGYTFVAWNTVRDGSGKKYLPGDNYYPDEPVTLYAQWSANTYRVRFDACGGKATAKEKDFVFDTVYSLPTATRKGYSFSGWYTSPEGGSYIKNGDKVGIDSDSVFYARWKANTYTVRFDPDGGNCETDKIRVSFGSVFGRLPVPVKKGFVFAGWFTAKDYETQITSDSVMKYDSDITLYAAFTPATYTVIFDTDGGTADTVSKTVRYGASYGELPVTAKTGYEFDGWFDADGKEITASDIVTKDYSHTLYAIWKAPEYKVTYHNGNSVTGTGFCTYGMPYGAMPSASVSGKIFCGWYDSQGNAVTENTVCTANADVNLYARFADTPAAGTVRFVADGTVVADKAYSGSQITEPAVPQKSGFSGRWEDYTPGTGGIVVQAVYEPVQFTATFVCQGKPVSVKFGYGEKIEIPSVTPEAGYAVAGWKPGIPASMPAADVTFTADVREITYCADFIAGGESVGSVLYTAGTKSLSEPAVSPRAGYTGEWEDYTIAPGGMTVFAVYTPIRYTAEFFADGVPAESRQFTVEDYEISLPPVPEKTGYSGEWEDYEIQPRDITINAVYTANVYTVTFMDKDTETVIGKVSYHYGDRSINEPAVPEKDQFTGKWSSYSLEATDAIAYAVYTPRIYIATFVAYGEVVAKVPFNAGSTVITAPPVPAKFGVRGRWESFNVVNADFTVNALYDLPTVRIKNYIPERNEDYKTSICFTADVSSFNSTALVHWYVDGRDVTPGGSLTYTVSNATESYSICAKLVADGKVIAESSSEQVNIKTGFFARFIAFFRQLFGRLPFINQ